MASMPEYVLRADSVKKSFGGVEALKGVSLEIRKGEIHCLAGENGCGKSTLIKIVSGVYEPDSGSVELLGKRYAKLSPMEAIARGVQVIYQDFSVFPNLTVMENLALNMELMAERRLVSYKRIRSIASEALAKLGIELDLDERVENLSVADRQLIAICRALLHDAKLIIMDEPTTALTKKEVKALFAIIKRLQSEGLSILFVSHKLDEVFEISERYTIFRNGQNVATGETGSLDRKDFVRYMTGREFADERYRPAKLGPVALAAKGLSLDGAFQDLSFELRSGEILGITGLLGSGRTELVQTLFGIYEPTAGSIEVGGKPARIRSVKSAIRRGIGYVPADRITEGLFLPQSIARNTVVSKLDKLSGPLGFLKRKSLSSEVERWVGELAIATMDPSLPVQTLSGGNQQKVVLARWLANDLSVLILNGPTVGVDIGSKYDIHALLRSLAERGLAIIVISDDLPEVLACASRIIVMRGGRIAQELDPASTTEERLGEISTGVA
jgi:simple sugar transport system ATP-binding protein